MRQDQLAYMPKTRQLVAEQGIEYENAFVTTPVCCPSRASILRGQYAHNHRVLDNRGGFDVFEGRGRESSTVATWLHDAGYKTLLVGKYLNSYDPEDHEHVPPGWDEWYAKLGTRTPYYGYSLSENGEVVSYGSDPEDYLTDVETQKAKNFVRQSAGDSRPLFMYLAPSAPHTPYVAAPRHESMFEDVRAPRPPSFDEKDVSDKSPWVRGLPRLSTDEKAAIDETYRTQLQMLQSLDDMVDGVVDELAATGRLQNTYIFFTSDNGMHFGEHRIPGGKGTAYEESIRVPLVARGPGIPAGRTTRQMALNIDFAPTLAELSGVEAPNFVDGRSLVPTFSSKAAAWRTAFLEESWGGQKVPTHRSVRTTKHKLVYYPESKGRELYDFSADPNETRSIFRSADASLRTSLRGRLEALKACSGQACRDAEDVP